MSVAPRSRIDEQHPWPGLGVFDEQAERFFNGRTTEAAELRRIVLQAPLTVLFGVSGLGKSSLLQAGLFPLVRRDNVLPVLLRLDFTARGGDLIDQARTALEREIAAHKVDAPAFAPGESLWEYLHRADLELWSAHNQLLTPLFVFDQFEEVFTLGADHRAAVAQLRNDIANLVENRIPSEVAARGARSEEEASRYALDSQRYRFLLSFREDFLPAIEGWKRELPSILRNRLRLLPMSGAEAFRAIHESAPDLTTPALAREIVQFVSRAQGQASVTGGSGEIHVAEGSGSRATRASGVMRAIDEDDSATELLVEPSLLSLVCHGLNAKRIAAGKTAIDEALLRDTGDSIVADFYAGAVSDFRGQVREFIESELITERGFRKPCDVDDAKQKYGITNDELRLLVERRLVRIEPARGTDRVELTHDLLTPVVRKHRDLEREVVRTRLRRKRLVFAGAALVLVALAGAKYGQYKLGKVIEEHEVADRQHQDSIRQAFKERTDSIQRAEAMRDLEKERSLNGKLVASQRQTKRAEERARAAADSVRDVVVSQQFALDSRGVAADLSVALRRLITRMRATGADADSVMSVADDLADARESLRYETLSALRGAGPIATENYGVEVLPFDGYSRRDLFDVRQGTRVLGGTTPRQGTLASILGDSLPGSTSRDAQPAVFIATTPTLPITLEWTTGRVVAVRSIALFAQHDGRPGEPPPDNPPGAIRHLTIEVRVEGETPAGDSIWMPVVDYSRPPVPYGQDAWGDDQPARSMAACLDVTDDESTDGAPVRASHFRLRIDSITAPFASTVRLTELDGFDVPSCGAASGDIDEIVEGRADARKLRALRQSTGAIARVLDRLAASMFRRFTSTVDTRSTEPRQAAVRFLANTDPSAWNQQLARRAESALRRLPLAAVVDSLRQVLRQAVPTVGALAALDAAADSATNIWRMASRPAVTDRTVLLAAERAATDHPSSGYPGIPIFARLERFRDSLRTLAALSDSARGVQQQSDDEAIALMARYVAASANVRGGNGAAPLLLALNGAVARRALRARAFFDSVRANAVADTTEAYVRASLAAVESARSRLTLAGQLSPQDSRWIAARADTLARIQLAILIRHASVVARDTSNKAEVREAVLDSVLRNPHWRSASLIPANEWVEDLRSSLYTARRQRESAVPIAAAMARARAAVASPDTTVREKRAALDAAVDLMQRIGSTSSPDMRWLGQQVAALGDRLYGVGYQCTTPPSCTFQASQIQVSVGGTFVATITRDDSSSSKQTYVRHSLYRAGQRMRDTVIRWDTPGAEYNKRSVQWTIAGPPGQWTLRTWDALGRLIRRYDFEVTDTDRRPEIDEMVDVVGGPGRRSTRGGG